MTSPLTGQLPLPPGSDGRGGVRTPGAARPGVRVTATARTTGRTGVEMEALTAATVAALTVYDMLKAAQKDMRIEGVRLLRKTGGKSGTFEAAP